MLMERVLKCNFKFLHLFILYCHTVLSCAPFVTKCIVFQDMIHVIKC